MRSPLKSDCYCNEIVWLFSKFLKAAIIMSYNNVLLMELNLFHIIHDRTDLSKKIALEYFQDYFQI